MHSNVHSAIMFNCIDLNVVLSFGHLLLLWVWWVNVCSPKVDTFWLRACVMDAWACWRVIGSPFCLSNGHWQASSNTITVEHKQVCIILFVIAPEHVWQTDFYGAIYTACLPANGSIWWPLSLVHASNKVNQQRDMLYNYYYKLIVHLTFN